MNEYEYEEESYTEQDEILYLRQRVTQLESLLKQAKETILFYKTALQAADKM